MAAAAAATTIRAGSRRGAEEKKKVVFDTTEGIEPIMSFQHMRLKDDLLRGIYDYGFEKPSAIQQRAMMPIINGCDVIAQSQSGTGKTSMIALTACQLIDTASREYIYILFSILVLYIYLK